MPQPAVSGFAADYSNGEHIELHLHDEHQIVHAQSGVMRVSAGALTWIIVPGRALWVPAGVLHEIICLTGVSTRTVYLSSRAPSLPERCEVWNVSPLMREIIIRFANEPDTPPARHLLAVLIDEIDRLDTVPISFSKVRSTQLMVMQDALLADPADPRTLAMWATDLGLAPRTMMRRLHQETGLTFRQWRRQIRMLKAAEALATGMPVTSAAFAVGYETTSAFIAAFHETMGSTPGRFFKPL